MPASGDARHPVVCEPNEMVSSFIHACLANICRAPYFTASVLNAISSVDKAI